MFSKKVLDEILAELDGLEYETMKLSDELYEGKITREKFDAKVSTLIETENDIVRSAVEEKYIYFGCICKCLHFNELFWSEYYAMEGTK